MRGKINLFPGILLAGILIFFAIFSFSGSSKAALNSRFLEKVGEGFIAPACGSSDPLPMICNGNPSPVVFSWTNESDDGDEETLENQCVTAKIEVNGVIIASGLPCTGNYTWNSAPSNTAFNYKIRFYDYLYWDGVEGEYVDDTNTAVGTGHIIFSSSFCENYRITSMSCVNNAQQVNFAWTYTGEETSGVFCLLIEPGAIRIQPPTGASSYTWVGGQSNASYTYELFASTFDCGHSAVQWQPTTGDIITENGPVPFSTLNCTPPPPPAAPSDYQLTLNPYSMIANVSGTNAVVATPPSIITGTSFNGYSGNITFGASAPSIPGATHEFIPASINIPANGNATSQYKITIPGNTTPGIYTITVTGSGGGLAGHTASPTITLSVQVRDPIFREVFAPMLNKLALILGMEAWASK